ncbi:MAG: MJ0042-type zinc finger domain-containing protein, partial [Pseudolabrys sp.]
MHIVCPNCSTSYAIEEASLGAAGRTVRCARCKTTWFASAHQPVPEMAIAEDADSF